ncbi:protein-disulfide reductase DsbD [Marinomonas algarum]|uniref:Protein-disulfide reductase DsbD n=1 Tax=Marinomonas algarum TaxID=2883105 RepID=A0A9X1IL93_9GAMM|nr:protein-disulfide reductase DsbD [Marinomonas algarum]MCB5161332.1 protein-disulfide reductase DsbD [Marinomonas algarum]
MRLFLFLFLLMFQATSFAFTFGATSAFSQPDFLPAEQVFKPTLSDPKEGQVTVSWIIEPGYYLYQSQLSLSGPDAQHLNLTSFPNGELKQDPYYGEVVVYREQLSVPIQYTDKLPPGTQISAQLSYQGCADQGLCYPPQTLPVQFTVPLSLSNTPSLNTLSSNTTSIEAIEAAKPVTTQNTKNATTPDVAPSEAESVSLLLGSDDLWSTLMIVFGLGLLLSLTPCVLPMVPIVSAIVVGTRDSRLGAFYYSVLYVLGMALTYAAIGGLVGVFGTQLNLQAQLQNPILLAFSAVLFVLLALAMFGLYELRLPSSWQQRLQMSNESSDSTWQSSVSVFITGVLSTLVVSPCVSAPLAGALLYIGGQGDAWYGAMMLFVMALGMGIPLLLVGLFGPKVLPKNGEWLHDIKVLMGFGLLAMAVWLLTRWLPSETHLFLWAILALSVSSFFFHRATKDTSHPVRWFFALILFITATLQFVGAVTGSSKPLQPLDKLSSPSASNGPSEAALFETTITSLVQLDRFVAASDERPIVLDFYADWCVSCKVLEEMFLEPEIFETLEKIQLVRVDVTKNTADNKALMQAFDVFGPPALIFLDNSGKERKKLTLMGEPSRSTLTARLQAHIAQ